MIPLSVSYLFGGIDLRRISEAATLPAIFRRFTQPVIDSFG